MPVWAQFDDFVVQVNANLAAHRHHQRFAALRLLAFFKMLHQISRRLADARLGAGDFPQCRPAAFQFFAIDVAFG